MRRTDRWVAPLVFAAAAALAVASTTGEWLGRFIPAVAGILVILFLARGILEGEQASSAGLVAISAFGGTILVALAAIAVYPAVAGGPFDPTFLLENLPDALPTIERTMSPGRMISAGIVFAAGGAAGYRLVRSARIPVAPRLARRLLGATLGLCLILNFVPLKRALARARRGGPELARFPPTTGLATDSEEPIFMLQLESVNALAEAGLVAPENTAAGSQARVFHDGVYFPFLVAGNMMTTRGQATILCGAGSELGEDLSRRPETISEPCLPELLRRSGYRTIFFSHSPDPEFGSTRKFALRIGFDETHFGDVAKKGDPARRWGYEDSVYYRRIMESLSARFPDPRRLFVYIAVCADHFPFDEAPSRASDPPAMTGQSFRARYLRTLAEQDRALAVFRSALRAYASDEGHLFVASDHSFPVGVNHSTTCAKGASPDNFLTTMAYVPPRSRAAEFCVGDRVGEFYGQAMILPTVFEVLNRRRYQGSLGPALWRYPPPSDGAPPKAPCSTFSQPFDGKFLVSVHDGAAFRYSFRDESLTLVDLRRDLLERRPRALVSGISPEEFSEKFGCDRLEINR